MFCYKRSWLTVAECPLEQKKQVEAKVWPDHKATVKAKLATRLLEKRGPFNKWEIIYIENAPNPTLGIQYAGFLDGTQHSTQRVETQYAKILLYGRKTFKCILKKLKHNKR